MKAFATMALSPQRTSIKVVKSTSTEVAPGSRHSGNSFCKGMCGGERRHR